MPAMLMLTMLMMAMNGSSDRLTPLYFMGLSVDHRRRVRRGDAIMDRCPKAREGGGAAVSTMVAQNIGADKWDRVGRITRAGIIQTLAITGVLVVLLTIADRPALILFLGADSPAVAIARHIQLLATWNFLLFGVALVLFGTVRANRAVLAPLIILAVSLIPVRLGFVILARPWLGADALWLSFPVSAVVDRMLAAGC